MDDYTPRSSVAAIVTGMVLAWVLAPAAGVVAYFLSTAHSPDAARLAWPVAFLGGGLSLIGVICIIVGIFRALRTIDFLGRREAERMETDYHRSSYAGR